MDKHFALRGGDSPVLLVVEIQGAARVAHSSYGTAIPVAIEDGIGQRRRAAADLPGGWTIIGERNRRGTIS